MVPSLIGDAQMMNGLDPSEPEKKVGERPSEYFKAVTYLSHWKC